jgi:hypothetical protein
VYSPKVLASIKGMEATIENRSVLVIMKRTSKDLDKLLFREADARPIRDMFYLWRLKEGSLIVNDFNKWNPLDTAKELEIQGRAYELFIPIVFLCKIYKPEWLNEIKNYIHEYEDIKKSLEENTLEANVMLAIYNIILEKQGGGTINVPSFNGYIGIHEIAEMLSRMGSEFRDTKITTLGYALRRLGFQRMSKNSGKKYRRVDGKTVMAYMESHRIDYSIRPPPPSDNETREAPNIEEYNICEAAEKEKNDDNVEEH